MPDAPEPAVGPSAVERRIVTVLFADLVGFTPLSERLDPEDVAAIQDAYFSTVRETISRYGGMLEKFIGDAAMAVFGVPRTRDDDAERAVRAGLALVGGIEQLGARLGLDPGELQLRVGVNSGEVVHTIDGPNAGRVTGDTVNTAARLQAAARPGTVLIGELTGLAVESAIELAEPEPVTLKGKAEPVRAREARSVRPDASRDEAMRGMRAPLLGRADDLSRLVDLQRGRLTVVAPPGVGKSRLLAELAARLEDRGLRVLRGRVRPHATSPFEPVAELLAGAGGTTALDASLRQAISSETRRGVLRHELRALLEPAGQVAGSVADLAAEREARFDAWIELIDLLVGSAASAWIVEDVHWASADLLAFLAHAAAAGGDRRIYLSARPSLLDTAPDWVAGGLVHHLSPLDATDATGLIRALVGDALPGGTVAAIAQRSDGNPLFIEELLRTWVGVGTLVRHEAGWRLTVEPDTISFPPTVQAIYAAQLDDLPTAARVVARNASVAGRRFAEAALEPLGVTEAGDGLAVLRHRALVDGPHADPLDQRLYAYRHALLRDAGYASLARAERSRLHAALAAWMERTAGERADVVAEAIGGHFAAALESLPALGAGDDDRSTLAAEAARWLARGAERALALAAHDRAIELLERSVELTPATEEHALAERRLRLGEVIAPVADLDRGIREMQQALDGFAHLLPDSREGYARAAHSLGNAYIQQIRFDEARASCAAALGAIGPADDAATARLIALHAFARSAVGERDGLIDELERAEAIGAVIEDPELHVDLLVYRDLIAGETPDVEPAASSELEAAARAIGRWRTVVSTIRQRGRDTGGRGGLRLLDEAAVLCEAHGLTEQAGWTDFARAEQLFVLGEWDEALAAGDRALDLAERYAYVRLGFRTWMALMPIVAARRDTERLARFDAWWESAREHFPPNPSPYGQVLLAATAIWRAATEGRPIEPPPDALAEVTREPDGNPHFQEALLTVTDAWLRADPPHLDPAGMVLDHVRAALDDEPRPLERATVGLLAASIAAARGDGAAASDAASAAEADAPWWQLRALRLAGSTGEADAIATRLGISGGRGSSRGRVPPPAE